MERVVRKKRLKGTAVYLTNRVYDEWLENLSAKELAMAMMPASQEEIEFIEIGDRKDFQPVSVKMPSWWVNWYKTLSLEDKLRFGRLIEKRLKKVGLVGSNF